MCKSWIVFCLLMIQMQFDSNKLLLDLSKTKCITSGNEPRNFNGWLKIDAEIETVTQIQFIGIIESTLNWKSHVNYVKLWISMAGLHKILYILPQNSSFTLCHSLTVGWHIVLRYGEINIKAKENHENYWREMWCEPTEPWFTNLNNLKFMDVGD